MRCETIEQAMSQIAGCQGEAENGFRYRTHCVYPSFTMVEVFVAKIGDGFRVHDGGNAFMEAWLHGRDDTLILNCLRMEAERNRLKLSDNALWADAVNLDWLPSAILAVANASGNAANEAVKKIKSSNDAKFVLKIGEVLTENFSRTTSIKKGFKTIGKSGKEHTFDYCLGYDGNNPVLIDAVSPNHNSISSKYVAFSDTNYSGFKKFAVYENPLTADDISLMQQVADIVPFPSLVEGSRRVLSSH